MTWATLLLLALVTGGMIYWLLILSEGAYLGKRAVVALYDWSAAKYDPIKGVMAHEDGIHLALPLLEALHRIPAPGQMHPTGAGKSAATQTRPLVLDVATGTGRLPVALLRQFDFGGRIVGLDLSQRMLAIAQSKTRMHHQSVAWLREDAMTLPFRPSTFHAVTCVEALEFLPSPGKALAEMARVLRPGGWLLVSNRVGIDALFLPGRAYHPRALEQKLEAVGMTRVRTRRWQTHYDLIEAFKPDDEQRQQ